MLQIEKYTNKLNEQPLKWFVSFFVYVFAIIYLFVFILNTMLFYAFSRLTVFNHRNVKRNLATAGFCIVTIVTMAQTENPTPKHWQASLFSGYQTGSMNGISIGANATYNRTIALDVRLSKGFFSELDFSTNVFMNKGKNQLYIQPGYGYSRRGNTDSYKLEIQSLHLGIGYKSEFISRLFVDTRLSLVKYINEFYKSSEISSFEKYNLNEKLFVELSVSIGFCFYCK